MKEKILSVILLFTVICTVTINTIVLLKQIDRVSEKVSQLEIQKNEAKNEAEDLFSDFMNKETFISLTVSHDDLTAIENDFVDLIGYLSVSDLENAEVAKSRLLHSLEHLRRLSGFNFDAII